MRLYTLTMTDYVHKLRFIELTNYINMQEK